MDDIYYTVAHRTDAEIAALKKRYDTFNETLIPRIFEKALGLTAVSWTRPTTWGTSHVVYIVRVQDKRFPLILRANTGFGKPERMLVVEKLITDRIAKFDIPVNKILCADSTRKQFPFDFQIQEQLPGADVEDHFRGSKDDYDEISRSLGKYVAGWGELLFDGFGRFDENIATKGVLIGIKPSMYDYIIVRLDEDIRYLVDADVLTIQKSDQVRKLFDLYKMIMYVPKGTIVQHDLADHNIMFDGVKTITGIFDWEAAIVGDPVLDLASCPTWKTHYPREEKLIEGYRSVRDLPENFQEKMNIYRLRTMLWKMVYAIRTGILNNDRKQKFTAALAPFKL